MIRRCAVLLAVLAASASIAGMSSAYATRSRAFVVYLKVTRFQFLNHADDRARGDITSPFDPDGSLPTPKSANSGAKGTRAGDGAVFTAKLYSDAGLKRIIGTAVYSCTFNFAQKATCDANFQLNDGTMFASGPADLTSGQFTLAVIGGTSAYLGSRGQVTSTPTAKPNTVRDDFVLVH